MNSWTLPPLPPFPLSSLCPSRLAPSHYLFPFHQQQPPTQYHRCKCMYNFYMGQYTVYVLRPNNNFRPLRFFIFLTLLLPSLIPYPSCLPSLCLSMLQFSHPSLSLSLTPLPPPPPPSSSLPFLLFPFHSFLFFCPHYSSCLPHLLLLSSSSQSPCLLVPNPPFAPSQHHHLKLNNRCLEL